jgi:hypothetical protein
MAEGIWTKLSRLFQPAEAEATPAEAAGPVKLDNVMGDLFGGKDGEVLQHTEDMLERGTAPPVAPHRGGVGWAGQVPDRVRMDPTLLQETEPDISAPTPPMAPKPTQEKSSRGGASWDLLNLED